MALLSDTRGSPEVTLNEEETCNVAERLKLKYMIEKSFDRTNEMFLGNYGLQMPMYTPGHSIRLEAKVQAEYESVRHLPPLSAGQKRSTDKQIMPPPMAQRKIKNEKEEYPESPMADVTQITGLPAPAELSREEKIADLVDKVAAAKKQKVAAAEKALVIATPEGVSENWRIRSEIIRRKREEKMVRPDWHAPWKLFRVLPGHQGWVRCLAVDPTNEWFASGAGDRIIKIWDLASGDLKLSLTGHISAVMGLEVSARHPYLFSCSQDKTVRCWDLETNNCIRKYHGHLSGVYTLKLHPTLDVLVSAGRDSCARVWDMRTKAQVRVLGGHKQTVGALITQAADPQIITGSHDSTIRLWDLAEGTAITTLTNHKKSVRAMVAHPQEFTFASASADNMKVWMCPQGKFLRNVSGHNAIVNALAINHENVLVSGGDNGSVKLWDWKTGYNFQSFDTVVQPGSLDSEAGIFDLTFDKTGSRLITAEADKTIKIYKEDAEATPQSHPVKYRAMKRKKW